MVARVDYLFKRRGSQNWHFRFNYPRALHAHFGRKLVDQNLKTTDRQMAELKAAELLHRHRLEVLEATNWLNGESRLGPWPVGEMQMSENTRVVATPDTVLFINGDRVFKQMKNEKVWKTREPAEGTLPQPKPRKAHNDIEHLERWIAHKNISGYLEREARATWALFQTLVDGKPLAECDRDDGRKLVNHLFNELENKSATVQKKVGHLCAAVNIAINEGKLKFNPFSSIIPKRNDAKDREKLFEPEMKLIRDGRDTFDREEWLLYMLCATTGMRRGEAYGIDREYVEDGIRYVIVGTKTDQSLRRVPLPDAVLPLLPRQIHGPLFKKDLKNLGRETLRQIRRLGVEKDIHGLRHRAKDRLRDGRCPLDIQHHLLGHEEKTVAQGYGTGYPIRELKIEIEKIGF